jgi:hypothetical protein
MHQKSRDRAVGDAYAIRPLRPRDRDNNGHQRHHHGHANREIAQRLGVIQRVFGGNKTGTPEHDKNRRRRARGKILEIMIHLPP